MSKTTNCIEVLTTLVKKRPECEYILRFLLTVDGANLVFGREKNALKWKSVQLKMRQNRSSVRPKLVRTILRIYLEFFSVKKDRCTLVRTVELRKFLSSFATKINGSEGARIFKEDFLSGLPDESLVTIFGLFTSSRVFPIPVFNAIVARTNDYNTALMDGLCDWACAVTDTTRGDQWDNAIDGRKVVFNALRDEYQRFNGVFDWAVDHFGYPFSDYMGYVMDTEIATLKRTGAFPVGSRVAAVLAYLQKGLEKNTIDPPTQADEWIERLLYIAAYKKVDIVLHILPYLIKYKFNTDFWGRRIIYLGDLDLAVHMYKKKMQNFDDAETAETLRYGTSGIIPGLRDAIEKESSDVKPVNSH